MKISRLLSILLVAAVLVLGFSAVTAQETEIGPITQSIIDRGELICGANDNTVGFGAVNDAGEFEGFDIDICRAVAAAILGDASAVSFRPLDGGERQAAIQSGEIDMMSRNTTWTLSRDVVWGAIFGPTTFYDGQGIMTLEELGVSTLEELDGSSICVASGTTTELNIGDRIESAGLDIEVITFQDVPSAWDAYLTGACQSWTTDKSGLVSFRSQAEDPGAHVILAETLSKEPLGPLSPQSDPQFAEIIAWTVFGMMNAEEFGINSDNVGDFLDSNNPSIQRLLGQGNNDSGNFLGIANDFMVTVLEQVGNYGELYERHIAPLGLDREGSVNDLWTRGGLIYAPPFR